MVYRHRQIGYLMITVSLAVVIFYFFLYRIISEEASLDIVPVTFVMALVVLILSSFVTLQVIVDEQYVRVKFGYGAFRKKFPVNQIVSAKSVKNHWYYGWGIKVWFWPYMWIYNISGFDAVEIITKSGKIYRIGTDEPKQLESFINQIIVKEHV